MVLDAEKSTSDHHYKVALLMTIAINGFSFSKERMRRLVIGEYYNRVVVFIIKYV